MTANTGLPLFHVFGESCKSTKGEQYRQIPDSMLGRLKACEQIVLRALLDIWDGKTKTDVKDPALSELTGLSRRMVQYALHGLQFVHAFILRPHLKGNVRVIERVKLDAAGTPKWKQRAASAVAPAAAHPPNMQLPPREAARVVLNGFRENGWDVALADDGLKLKWKRLRQDAAELSPIQRTQVEIFRDEIIAVLRE